MRGYVKDNVGSPIEVALVILGTQQEYTGNNGYFGFLVPSIGTYNIQASKNGYQPYAGIVNVVGSITEVETITLTSSTP